MFIDSTKIEVFPVAKKRIDSAPGTRIFTEKNTSNMIRQLLSSENPGFIISCEKKSDNFDISFNLYGYYFNIEELNLSSFVGTSVYACITIGTDNELFGQDEGIQNNYVYTGLELLANKPEDSSEKKCIKLFDKVGDDWKCSSQNFGLMSALAIGGIDGKYK